MQVHNEQLYFMDSDPAGVNTSSFDGAFRGAWGVSATQITDFQSVSGVNFDSKSSYTANNWASAKPSISVSISPVGGGALVPLEFTYSMTWDEIGKIMGRTVTKIDNVTELFNYLKLLFENVGGVMTPVVDADGEYGIAASQAQTGGALSITNGNNGLSMVLKIYVANVKQATDGKPRLIDGRLVVADGVEDGAVAGSVWLLKRTGGSGGVGSGGGGGGGCDALNAGAILVVLVMVLFGVTKRRKI